MTTGNVHRDFITRCGRSTGADSIGTISAADIAANWGWMRWPAAQPAR